MYALYCVDYLSPDFDENITFPSWQTPHHSESQMNQKDVQGFLAMEKEAREGLIEMFHVKQLMFSYVSCLPLIGIPSFLWVQ